jgi:predicted GNAT family acetyltransferase
MLKVKSNALREQLATEAEHIASAVDTLKAELRTTEQSVESLQRLEQTRTDLVDRGPGIAAALAKATAAEIREIVMPVVSSVRYDSRSRELEVALLACTSGFSDRAVPARSVRRDLGRVKG